MSKFEKVFNDIKEQTKLESFVVYCKMYPEQRFWQALRNWSGYEKIYGEKYNEKVDDFELIDTFYK